MRKNLGILLLVLSTCLPSGAEAVEVAGSLLVDVDADGLSLGPISSWSNNGTLGGSFEQIFGAQSPSVIDSNDGYGGTTVQVIATFPGQNDTCFQLKDGLGTPITAPASIGVDNDYSLEAWIKCDVSGISGENSFFGWGNRPGDVAQFDYGDSWWSGAYVSWADYDVGWPQTSLGMPVTGRFHHIVYTNSAPGLKIYLDGRRVYSHDWIGNRALAGDPITVFNIATDYWNWGPQPVPTGAHEGMPGEYAKVRLHDGVLTEMQVWRNCLEEAPLYVAEEPALPPGMLVLLEPAPAFIAYGDLGGEESPKRTVRVRNISTYFDAVITGIEIVGDSTEFTHNLTDYTPLPPGEERSFEVWSTATARAKARVSIKSTGDDVSFLLSAYPGTIHVDDDGNDASGDGSPSNPYATLEKAKQEAIPGETVEVAPGAYNGIEFNDIVHVINFIANPIGSARINTPGPMWIRGEHVEISFTGFDVRGGDVCFFTPYDQDHYFSLELDLCRLKRTGTVIIADTMDRLVITNCEVDAGNQGQCVVGGPPVGYVELRNSTFTNPGAEAVNFWGLRGDLTADRCLFEKHSGNENCFGVWGAGTIGDAAVTNCIADYSSDTDWAAAGFRIADLDGNVTFLHCTAVANNGALYHRQGIDLIDCNGTVVIANCAAVGAENPAENITRYPPGATLSCNYTSIDGDPGFTNPPAYSPSIYVGGTGDFAPAPGSPLIRAGDSDRTLIEDYLGSPRPMPLGTVPDIGAIEEQRVKVVRWDLY